MSTLWKNSKFFIMIVMTFLIFTCTSPIEEQLVEKDNSSSINTGDKSNYNYAFLKIDFDINNLSLFNEVMGSDSKISLSGISDQSDSLEKVEVIESDKFQIIFYQISTGKWSIDVDITGSLADYFTIENDSYDVTVEEGKLNSLTVNMIEDRVSPVTFSQEGGYISSGTKIELSTATNGATIYYSTTNSTPTIDDTQYINTPITLNDEGTYTIYAIATMDGLSDSLITSETYTIDNSVTPNPQFISAAGNYQPPFKVMMSCALDTADIFYSINGADPTTSSSLYNSETGIVLDDVGTYSIKAIAKDDERDASSVVEREYVIELETLSEPVITPESGNFTDTVTVEMSTTEDGASIYYTTDGSDPDEFDDLYSSSFTISDAGTHTVKAVTVKSGYKTSGISEETYIITSTERVSIPVFSPLPGTFTDSVSVTISSDSGASIYYTLDNSTPDADGDLYTESIVIDTPGQYTVKAIAVKDGYLDSLVASAEYIISASNDVIVYFQKPAEWSSAYIHYSLDNEVTWTTTPGDEMSDLGNGWYKKVFDEGAEITFVFNDNGNTWMNKNNDGTSNFFTDVTIAIKSDGTQGEYNEGPVAPVVNASPGSKNFTSDSIEVTLSVTGDDITASKYTTNGSDPKTSGTSYVNGQKITIGSSLSIGQTQTLRLYAVNDAGESTKTFTYKKVEEVEPDNDMNNLRIYQVMVGAFQDGDGNVGYGTGYGPSSYNGDLQGIIDSIDYIKDLGMNAIWMTPIFNSWTGDINGQSTGYYADDYYNVDPNFGTNGDLRTLVDTAHAEGLYIILDGVFGHTGANTIDGVTTMGAQWYGNKVKYPESLDYFRDVATYWIDEYAIDGWRLDQAYQLTTFKNEYQDRSYWTDIREAVESISATRAQNGETWGTLGYMVGEIWDSETVINDYGYVGHNGEPGLRSNFEFPVRYSLVQTLAQEEWGSTNGKRNLPATNLKDGMDKIEIYPDFARPNYFLTNHDLIRFGNLIKEAHGYGPENGDYWKRHKAAHSFIAAQSGPMTMYYGDEIGQMSPGSYPKDNETPNELNYYWDNWARTDGKTSGLNANEQNLYDYTSTIMNIRAQHPALYTGERTHLYADDIIYIDLKTEGSEKIVYVLNTGTSSESVSVTQSSVGGSQLRSLITSDVVSASGGDYTMTVDGLTGDFYIVE